MLKIISRLKKTIKNVNDRMLDWCDFIIYIVYTYCMLCTVCMRLSHLRGASMNRSWSGYYKDDTKCVQSTYIFV